MFEVGKLVARIGLEGAATFGADLDKIGKQFKGLSTDGQAAAREVGGGLLTVGAGITALAGLAITKFASFDKAMSEVSATTGETAGNMDLLRKAAIDAGGATKYSAEQAAGGLTELAKAGVSTKDMLGGGLTGALSLAAAGQITVAEAAETAATAMTQFRLSGEKIPHLADLLSAGANKAQGSVGDLSAALKQSGLVASQMGLSVEDTIGTLSAFAAAGLTGSDAGTSFKTMLLALANPSKEAQAALKSINVEAYDAQGNFVGIADLAGQLQRGLKGSTQATRDQTMATIFGSDAIRASNVLLQQGTKGINDWTAAVDDSGNAARTAAELQNNLAGDVEKLGGAFDSALIQTGEGANGVLREMVQNVTAVVDAYGSMDPVLQQAVLVLGLAVGGVTLFGGALLLGIPKIVAFRAAMATLNAEVPALRGSLAKAAAFLTGPWGVALAAGAIGLKLFTDYMDSLKASSEEYQNAIANVKSPDDLFKIADQGRVLSFLDEATQSSHAFKRSLDELSTNPFATGFNLSSQQLKKSLSDIGTQLSQTAKSDLPAAQKAFAVLAEKMDLNKKEQWQLLESMPEYKDALVEQATALGLDATSTDENANKKVLLGLALGTVADKTEQVMSTQDALVASTDAAAAANEAWRKELRETDADFIDLGGAYDTVIQKNKDMASATAEGTASSSDSWEDFYDGFSVNVEDYLAELQRQVDAQNNWESNMVLLSGRVSKGVLDELAKLGPEGAPLIASLTTASDAELAKLEPLYAEKAENATAAFADRLSSAQIVIAAASAQLGTAAASEIAAKLAAGTSTVSQIMNEYGLRIESLNPQVKISTSQAQANLDAFIAQNGNRVIGVRVATGAGGTGGITFADGGEVHYYANGGTENHVAQIARAGVTRVWAEPETGGELYAPLAPSKRAQSLSQIGQVVREWGYDLVPQGARRSTSAAPAAAPSGGAQKIEGTLDLGNGLTGFVRGIVVQEFDQQNDSRSNGSRPQE